MTQTNPGSFQVEWNNPGLTERQVRLTLIGVMFAMFLASLDQTIVATAIPRIMADLMDSIELLGFQVHTLWLQPRSY